MGDQSGVYTRPYNFTNDAAADHGTDPAEFDAELNQAAAALNNRIFADGSASNITADIPMGGHSFTGLRPGAAKGEVATYEQVSFGAFAFCAAIVF